MSVLLKAERMSVHFGSRAGLAIGDPGKVVKAVDEVTFDIREGETFSLVGESGCGKSTLARALLQLQPLTSGKVYFDGADLAALPPKAMKRMRRRMQMVFQDPFASLNPRMTIGQIVAEPIIVHKIAGKRDARKRASELLETVGLNARMASRYPHEFSGGQRQRVVIARALASGPDFILCDEAISALDVSIQAQIINLLSDLQQELNLTYLFIAHDLAVVRHLSHRIAAMYAGRIVEIADRDSLYADPRHPYTRLLLSAAPTLSKDNVVGSAPTDPGDTASRAVSEVGCRFANRCPLASEICSEEAPPLRRVADGHEVACHHG